MTATDVTEFNGRHYETGTIANWLRACGYMLGEEMVFGASGGIAFGTFMFEYSGYLPHIALLTRNTFSPFERALDNLGVKRTRMETVKAEKGEENLRRELELGHPVVVWGDIFTADWIGYPKTGMWAMVPMLVTGFEGGDFSIVDQCHKPFNVPAAHLGEMRAKVKKDRFRILVLEGVDEARQKEGFSSAIETCLALYLDKPPAGSAKNWGVTGMESLIKLIRDERSPTGWGKKFASGDNFKQAVAGRLSQPGLWDWIEGWGTAPGADRETFASFLRQAGPVVNRDLGGVAAMFDACAPLWRSVAESAMPDSIPALRRLKEIKRERAILRFADTPGSIAKRADLAEESRELWTGCGDLAAEAPAIREAVASAFEQVFPVERDAILALRAAMA